MNQRKPCKIINDIEFQKKKKKISCVYNIYFCWTNDNGTIQNNNIMLSLYIYIYCGTFLTKKPEFSLRTSSEEQKPRSVKKKLHEIYIPMKFLASCQFNLKRQKFFTKWSLICYPIYAKIIHVFPRKLILNK